MEQIQRSAVDGGKADHDALQSHTLQPRHSGSKFPTHTSHYNNFCTQDRNHLLPSDNTALEPTRKTSVLFPSVYHIILKEQLNGFDEVDSQDRVQD